MSTWHIDPWNGSNVNDGTSWASAFKYWSDASASTIAPGDTIKIAKSPDPTEVGDATWAAGPVTAAKAIASSTNQTPITVTISSHGYSTGDVVWITGHGTNTNANGMHYITVNDSTNFSLMDSTGTGVGSGGTCRLWNQNCVRLNARVTDDIDHCETVWTGVDAACTPGQITTDANWKDGTSACTFALAAGAATGLQAYHALPATLDLSGYEQISFWAKSTVTLADGDLQLMLCSDAAGEVGDATCNIPAMTANSQYQICVVNKYTALPSSVQSIALYQAVDKGALTFYLDNVVACKASSEADSLNHSSLISPDSGAHDTTNGWWGLQSIKSGNAGTILALDNRTTWSPSQLAGECYGGYDYEGSLYKRECYTEAVATSTASTVHTSTEAGAINNPIIWSGGWDTTSDEQNGCTYYDGRSGWGQNQIAHGYTQWQRLGFARYYYAWRPSNIGIDATGMGSICCCERGIQGESNYMSYDGISINQCQLGVLMDSYKWFRRINLRALDSNVTMGIYTAQTGEYYKPVYHINRIGGNVRGIGANAGANGESFWLRDCTMQSNYSSSIYCGYSTSAYLTNCHVSDTWATGNAQDCRIYSQTHNGIINNHYVLTDGGTITDQTTTVYGSEPAWDFSLTSSRNQWYPLDLKLARIPCTAGGNTITVTAHMKLSHATNVGASLAIEGGQILGVPREVETDATASTDWQNVTVSCTPSEVGEVEVVARTWYLAGNGNVYVDNELTVTQG